MRNVVVQGVMACWYSILVLGCHQNQDRIGTQSEITATPVEPPAQKMCAGVTLRLLTADDAADVQRLVEKNKGHLQRFMKEINQEYGGARLLSEVREVLAEEKRFAEIFLKIKEGESNGYMFSYGIFFEEQLVGMITAHSFNGYRPHTCDIGYWIDEDFVRRGITRTAAYKFIYEVLFPLGGVAAVNMVCEQDNVGSVRLIESLQAHPLPSWEQSAVRKHALLIGKWTNLENSDAVEIAHYFDYDHWGYPHQQTQRNGTLEGPSEREFLCYTLLNPMLPRLLKAQLATFQPNLRDVA